MRADVSKVSAEAQASRAVTQRRDALAQRHACRNLICHSGLMKRFTPKQIQPRLAGIRSSALSSALGVTRKCAINIRAGRRCPHPRHWERIRGRPLLIEPRASQNKKRWQRVERGTNGKFSFRNLVPGSYEVRSSIDTGWDVTSVKICNRPKEEAATRNPCFDATRNLNAALNYRRPRNAWTQKHYTFRAGSSISNEHSA
jgi:hypothetical protein